MSHYRYPTADELADRLKGAGIKQSKIDLLKEVGTLGDAVKAAANDWEDATGWKPYLAGDATTVAYDPPYVMSGGVPSGGTRLALGNPLLSVTSIVASGQLLTRGRDYVLGPQNAAAEERPYQWIIFNGALGSTPGSIQITGQWGRVARIPDNVWDVLLKIAEMSIAGDLGLVMTGGVTEIKIDIITKKFGANGPLDAASQLWLNRINKTVDANKRVTF